MKQKQSPLELSTLYFTDYTWQDVAAPSFSPEDLNPDRRHDFLIDCNFAGIAAELHFHNARYCKGKGVRRKLSLLLFDASDRVLIKTHRLTLRIPNTAPHCRIVVPFPIEETDYRSGHAFRLQVRDDNAGQLLGEGCFRTYGFKEFGDPADWYVPKSAGLVPVGATEMFKSCDAAAHESRHFRIRFKVIDNLPPQSADILPELQVRVHYPGNARVDVNFIEPLFSYTGDLTHTVDCPFFASQLFPGIYYAELLCMDCPFAGFVFSIGEEVEGFHSGDTLMPLEEYDYEEACRRYDEEKSSLENSDLPEINDNTENDEDEQDSENFDQLLDAFIASEEDENDGNSPILSEAPILNTEADHPILPDEDLLSELDTLTGLDSVKEKIRTYDSLMRFCMLRAKKGLEMFHAPLHAMFLGSPGTGKTTVAKLMGKMLKKAGVLSSGHVIMRERSTLLGQYYHSEAEKTLEAIEQAQGGILFIDEAHSLFQPHDPKDPGKFVIEALLTALADPEKDDWMLILAGYADEMHNLFKLNPGFKSRIPDSNIYTFEDFSEGQLMEIAERRLEHLDFTLSSEAREALQSRLGADYAQRDRNFGNARHVRNLIESEIIPAMARRVMDASLTDFRSLQEVQPSDIPMPKPKSTPLRRPLGFFFPTAS